MKTGYQAILRREGKWWVGWVPALPGVMSQGETRGELVSNLRSCIREWREIQEEDARSEAGAGCERELIEA